MRQLGLRFLTLGKKSTSHGVSLTRNRRSRFSVECLERRELLVAGMLTGVAYSIVAVTGTDQFGFPYIYGTPTTGNLTTASGSLPITYNEQFPPGYATMNGTVNFTFPQTVTLGQKASISATAQATWNNSGLGFGRPTLIDISDGIGPDGLDNLGSYADGPPSPASGQVNWSDSVAVPTGPGSVTLPAVTVTVDGKEDKIVTLTASYQIAPTLVFLTQPPADVSGSATFPITVAAETANGAVDTGLKGAVTLALDENGAPAGTVSTASLVNGKATFHVSASQIGIDAGTDAFSNLLDLLASSPSASPATSHSFTDVTPPVMSSPGAVVSDTEPEFTWTPVSGATSYQLLLRNTTPGIRPGSSYQFARDTVERREGHIVCLPLPAEPGSVLPGQGLRRRR